MSDKSIESCKKAAEAFEKNGHNDMAKKFRESVKILERENTC